MAREICDRFCLSHFLHADNDGRPFGENKGTEERQKEESKQYQTHELQKLRLRLDIPKNLVVTPSHAFKFCLKSSFHLYFVPPPAPAGLFLEN